MYFARLFLLSFFFKVGWIFFARHLKISLVFISSDIVIQFDHDHVRLNEVEPLDCFFQLIGQLQVICRLVFALKIYPRKINN